MQAVFEHLGVAVAAITGVLAAKGKRVDLFGVLVLAVVTAFGGGSVRDVLLGAMPVFWVADPYYLLTATGAAVAWFFLAPRAELPRRVLLVADAGALALFTIVGVQKAIVFHASAPIAITMGIVTGVAGGILRDTLLGEIPLVFRREINFYATAALFGAVTYMALWRWFPHPQTPNMVISVAVILAIRLAAIKWSLSLPEFELERDEAD